MKKRIFCVLVMLCMVLAMMPASVYAGEEGDRCSDGHEFAYRSLGNGTHEVVCVKCQYSPGSEACSGQDGRDFNNRPTCSRCGEKYGYKLNSAFTFKTDGYSAGAAVKDYTVSCSDTSTQEQLVWAGDSYDQGFFISTKVDTVADIYATKIDASGNAVFKEYTDYYLIIPMVLGEYRTLENTRTDEVRLDGGYCSEELLKIDDTYYAIFELPQLISCSIPIKKTVVLGENGGAEPGKTTFTFKAVSVINYSGDDYCDEVYTGTIETNGAGTYTGEIIVRGSENDFRSRAGAGFTVWEEKGDSADWTYSDEIYFMGPYLNDDFTVTGWYATPAVLVNDEDKSCIDDEKMDWEGDGSVAEFTNTYTKTTTAPIKTDSDNNVKTGDTYAAVIIPALAVMLIAAAGAVFALRRKKNM
jgi:hypothetical protein